MKIVSLKDAIKQGVKRYFTGIPCKRGHISERFTSASHCVECNRTKFERNPAWLRKSTIAKAQWAENNPEKINASVEKYLATGANKQSGARWRAKNREFDKQRAAIWRRKNPELAAAVTKAWRQKNKDIRCATQHRRRARKTGAGGSYKPSDIKDIFFAQKGRCGYCRIKLKAKAQRIDHIVPIAKGGTSNRQNLQLLCHPCNGSKGAKDQIEFMQAKGRLL